MILTSQINTKSPEKHYSTDEAFSALCNKTLFYLFRLTTASCAQQWQISLLCSIVEQFKTLPVGITLPTAASTFDQVPTGLWCVWLPRTCTHSAFTKEETSPSLPVSAEDVRCSDGTLTMGPMTAVRISLPQQRTQWLFLIQWGLFG